MTKNNIPEYSQHITATKILQTYFYKYFFEFIVRIKNSIKKERFLEIGPGENRIPNFETLNVYKTVTTDYIGNATKKIPFKNETFNLIYASHVLEHVPWYQLNNVISEWARVLKRGGGIEIWVPDGLKIMSAYVNAEKSNSLEFYKDGWFRYNKDKDPLVWVSGRVFSYGDGMGTLGHYNWHHSLFSQRFLFDLLKTNGFDHIVIMDNKECRGYDHGWINLGVRALKK